MSKSATPEQKRYHHGDLKQALLDETARILREEGESALSLRRLASSLGVSRTAPYNHFENKDALLSAVAEEGFGRFEKAMRSVRRRHRNSSGGQFFRALVHAYIKFALNNQEYYDLMFSSRSWHAGAATETLAATARQTLRKDIDRLRRAQDERRISQDLDVAAFVQIQWGTLHGISRLTLDGVYSDPASLRKLCNATADMLWRQLDPAE
jgi:AcrR family transcriptional regulator